MQIEIHTSLQIKHTPFPLSTPATRTKNKQCSKTISVLLTKNEGKQPNGKEDLI